MQTVFEWVRNSDSSQIQAEYNKTLAKLLAHVKNQCLAHCKELISKKSALNQDFGIVDFAQDVPSSIASISCLECTYSNNDSISDGSYLIARRSTSFCLCEAKKLFYREASNCICQRTCGQTMTSEETSRKLIDLLINILKTT